MILRSYTSEVGFGIPCHLLGNNLLVTGLGINKVISPSLLLPVDVENLGSANISREWSESNCFRLFAQWVKLNKLSRYLSNHLNCQH